MFLRVADELRPLHVPFVLHCTFCVAASMIVKILDTAHIMTLQTDASVVLFPKIAALALKFLSHFIKV